MEYVVLTHENLEREHICCAISSPGDPQVRAKKAWLADRLAEGLVFRKGDVRGKCFIEYLPAECAWTPIEAEGYMHIDCFWVSGQCKGHGYGGELLDACIADSRAKGKRGLCVISSKKKLPFLSDPQFLATHGFQVADTAEPYFTLMYLSFEDGAPLPRFCACAKHPQIAERGFVLFYTHACPFTAKYVPLLEKTARENGIPLQSVWIDSRDAARHAPAVWTNFALFWNGRYLTHEIPSEAKLLKLAAACMAQGENA